MWIKLPILALMFILLALSSAWGNDIYYRGKISPYRIVQKSKSVLYDAESYEQIIQEWYQGPGVHRKSRYVQRIKDLSDLEVEGRVSYSYYGSGVVDSDSFWVKAYTIRGVPFSWDSRKKKWKNKALHIEDKYAREQISYSFLYALGGMDLGGIDPESFKFLDEEEGQDKFCYVVSYRYLPEMLKSWGLVGKLRAKLWIEKESFLPFQKRIEGNIAGMNYLQIINYQKYGEEFSFDLPDYVSKESAKEKTALEAKVKKVKEEVSKIRGWQPEEIKEVKIEFAKKSRIKEAMHKDLKATYSEEKLTYEGYLLKWLGLIPKDADYHDLVFDSSEVGSIAGLYIPRIKTVFVADDLDPAQAEITLAHELVHAFQDQKLNLQALTDKLLGDIDALRALMCFIEGEAAAVQLEYLLHKSDETLKDWEDISVLIDRKVVHGYSRNKVFYRVYGYGAIFIQHYLKNNPAGGSWSWPNLHNLYQDYPASMEEIMHPEEYAMKVVAKQANKNSQERRSVLNSRKIEGWREAYTNKLGQYHLFLMFDEKLERQIAEKAAIGWMNDRVDIYEKEDGGRLVILQSQWDTPGDAGEFYAAYQDWLRKKKFIANAKDEQSEFFVNSEDSEIITCISQGNAVTVVGTQDIQLDTFAQIVEEIFPQKTTRR